MMAEESFMKEFIDLSERLRTYGFDTRTLRRFAITQGEAVEFIKETMSDHKTVPAIGCKCELNGIRCIVIADD